MTTQTTRATRTRDRDTKAPRRDTTLDSSSASSASSTPLARHTEPAAPFPDDLRAELAKLVLGGRSPCRAMLGALIAARATDDEMWNGCGEFNFRHPDGGTIADAEALAAAILKRPLRDVERAAISFVGSGR
jgi:hypothetical protein